MADLTAKYSFDVERTSTHNILDSTMEIGRSLRRERGYREIRSWKLRFQLLNKDALNNVITLLRNEVPFSIDTPDDGQVTVLPLNDTVQIEQPANIYYNLEITVQEFF